MDNTLPNLYGDYGRYSNWRNMPLDIDGLKPVERRVLLSAYKIARSKYVKSRQVDAYTIGHYHPHGEVYGTVVQLVRQGFLDGQGNFGSNVGVEPVGPAAPRYTECKINENTLKIAFKYIDFVPWIETELSDKEPIYLPVMFPICLMGTEYTQGIGFGYKTFIPCYDINDLYKRLLWLLGIRKRKPIIQPIIDCDILSEPNVLDELLTTGKAKIEVKGVYEVNKRNNTVRLKSWPPGKRFASLLNKFAKELNENMIGFTDLSVHETDIVFQVLRERNRDKIFSDFLEKMEDAVKGSVSFESVYVDINQKVVTKGIDEMLLETYRMYSNINTEMLKSKINSINEQINEYNMLVKIKEPLFECVQKKTSIDTAVKVIEKKTGIPHKYVKELISKYRISKLLTLDLDTSDLESTVKNLEANLKDIDNFVLEQYKDLK